MLSCSGEEGMALNGNAEDNDGVLNESLRSELMQQLIGTK